MVQQGYAAPGTERFCNGIRSSVPNATAPVLSSIAWDSLRGSPQWQRRLDGPGLSEFLQHHRYRDGALWARRASSG